MSRTDEFTNELTEIKDQLAEKINDLQNVLDELEALLIKCGLTPLPADKWDSPASEN